MLNRRHLHPIAQAIAIVAAFAAMGAARAAEPAQPPGPPEPLEPTAAQWRRIAEEQASQIRTLTTSVEQLQGTVSDLKGRLDHYETRHRHLEDADQQRQREQEAILTAIEQLHVQDEAGYGSGYGSSLGNGLDISFWGWLTYQSNIQAKESTFWAWELEMDVTKTFSERLAAGFDLDVIDMRGRATVNLEQLFLNALVSEKHQTVLTAGKFNAPFGIEPRDFWDRRAATTSLLFRAMPQDLTGLMITQPIHRANLTLQPFVVNGFDDNLDVNNQPSVGLTATWRPHEALRLAATGFFGPEMENNTSDKQYETLLQGTWQVTPRLELAAESLYGSTQSPAGRMSWWGAAALANLDLDERWRLFGRWSFLDDEDGYITGTAQQRQEISTGLSWQLHPHVELRTEYRHNFIEAARDEDEISGHLTFGF